MTRYNVWFWINFDEAIELLTLECDEEPTVDFEKHSITANGVVIAFPNEIHSVELG